MSLPRQKMDGVDVAWLRMESPTNLMMIGAMLIFEDHLDLDLLRKSIENRLLKFDRFRERVIEEGGKHYWELDPVFSLDNHMHRIVLPSAKDKEALKKIADELISTPLDFNRPLWQMHIVEDYQGGSAIFVRIHHCIADGISLVRVLLSLTDKERVPSSFIEEQQKVSEKTPHHKTLLERIWAPLVRQATELGNELYEDYVHPEHIVEDAKKGIEMVSELSRVMVMHADPHSALKRQLTGRKRVAWAEPIALPRVKATGKLIDATINDVLLSVAAGALRRYLHEQKENMDDINIHVAVPLNLRPLDQPIEVLGNQFGLVLVELPTGIADTLKRLDRVKQNMVELKRSYQAQVFYGLLAIFGKGPTLLEKTALEILSKKASAMMTNVPGPKESLYLGGAKLIQPMVWAPQSGEIGVGFSILSYNGTVQFGLVSDIALLKNTDRVAELFVEEFEHLEKVVLKSKELESKEPKSKQRD